MRGHSLSLFAVLIACGLLSACTTESKDGRTTVIHWFGFSVDGMSLGESN